LKTHWDAKCLNCGHRKGSHSVVYEPVTVEGHVVSRHLYSMTSIGHCAVDRREFGAEKCSCQGFSDGRLWKDGKRLLHEEDDDGA